MKRGSGRFSDQTTKRKCRVHFNFINRACTRRSVRERPMIHLHAQGQPRSAREEKRQHLRMIDEERKPCWKCEELNATRVIFSACSVMSFPRFAKKRRSRQCHTSGHLRHRVFNQPCGKKKPPADDGVDNQKKSTSSSLLPMLFGGQRERVSPTQMTQQERRRSSFFFEKISDRVAVQKLGSTAIVRSNGTRSPKRRSW